VKPIGDGGVAATWAPNLMKNDSFYNR